PPVPQPDLHVVAAVPRLRRARRHRHRRRRVPGGRRHQSPARGPLARLRLLADRTLHVIDFRYHLVSIVAIFLALALGIVLGSTTLSDSVSDTLRQQANQAAKTAQQARTQQRQLQEQVNGQEQFAAVLSPQIVAGRLKGQSVVMVEAPGAGDDSIEQISELAKNAGAAVTGRVTIQKKLLDDDQQMTLEELATKLKTDDGEFRGDANAYDKAGAVLAAALVTKDPDRSGREDAASGAVLNGFKEAGYITATGKPGQHAT